MQSLVQLASVRRSLFSTDEKRVQYLIMLITITVDLMRQPQVLTRDSDCFLHFCRLLARLKANYQLAELVKMDIYPEWIQAVAAFTDIAFKNYQHVENGVHYLLGLWSRLTVSIPFMKGDSPTHLQSIVPQIFSQFIRIRVEAIRHNVEDDDIDAVFDPVDLEETMKNIPTLGRLNYGIAAQAVIQLIDPIAAAYSQATEAGNGPFILLAETQLAWIIFLIASLTSSQPLPGTDPLEQEGLDAEMIARVFRLLKVLEFRQTRQAHLPVSLHFAMSLLKFYSDFRRQYIGNAEVSVDFLFIFPMRTSY